MKHFAFWPWHLTILTLFREAAAPNRWYIASSVPVLAVLTHDFLITCTTKKRHDWSWPTNNHPSAGTPATSALVERRDRVPQNYRPHRLSLFISFSSVTDFSRFCNISWLHLSSSYDSVSLSTSPFLPREDLNDLFLVSGECERAEFWFPIVSWAVTSPALISTSASDSGCDVRRTHDQHKCSATNTASHFVRLCAMVRERKHPPNENVILNALEYRITTYYLVRLNGPSPTREKPPIFYNVTDVISSSVAAPCLRPRDLVWRWVHWLSRHCEMLRPRPCQSKQWLHTFIPTSLATGLHKWCLRQRATARCSGEVTVSACNEFELVREKVQHCRGRW